MGATQSRYTQDQDSNSQRNVNAALSVAVVGVAALGGLLSYKQYQKVCPCQNLFL